MIEYANGGTHFFVKSPLKSFKNIGGRWSPIKNAWKLPANASVVRIVSLLLPSVQLPESLLKLAEGFGFPLREVEHSKLETLYPFQREGVRYLVSSPHGGSILVYEQGLGKTPTTIVAADVEGAKRILVVCPKSLIKNWIIEIRKWSNRTHVADCHRKDPVPVTWNVANYETVTNRIETYSLVDWDLVIVDESVLIKNRNTSRFRAIKKLRASAKRVWLLSGSPVTKYADDLWSQFHAIDPKAFSSYWRFAEKFCLIERDAWGVQILGSNPRLTPRTEHPDYMLVRSQAEVLPDLPELIFQTIPVELTSEQRKAHSELESVYETELSSGVLLSATTILPMITRLQQVTSGALTESNAKLDALMELVDSASIQFPAIVWVHWRETAEKIHKALTFAGYNARLAIGGMDVGAEVERFKRGETEVLVLSLGVGKFGHTLVNAKTAVYFDKTWDADAYIQSVSRVHRIGLTHRPLIVSLVAELSVDQMIEANLAGKLPSITAINKQDLLMLMKGISGYGTSDA